MVERCPSGALTYTLPGADGDVEPALAEGVAVLDDGPLWVTGSVPVERADGKSLETRNRMVLCRCGQSKNKPLGDGLHSDAGFTDHAWARFRLRAWSGRPGSNRHRQFGSPSLPCPGTGLWPAETPRNPRPEAVFEVSRGRR